MDEKWKIFTMFILSLTISFVISQATGDWSNFGDEFVNFGIVFGTLFAISIFLYVAYCTAIIYLFIKCPIYHLWCNAMSTENLL